VNLKDAQNVSKLMGRVNAEVSKSTKAAYNLIDKIGKHNPQMAQLVKADSDKMFKFAKKNSVDDVKIMTDKMLRKWQSKSQDENIHG